VVARKRVERLMRTAGIRGLPRRRHVVTTDADPRLPVAPDLLQQDFTAPGPDRRWVGDITYIPTHQGWLYLAVIMDLYSRRIVGWAMRNDLSTELALGALDLALATRHPAAGLVHHSDRGCQYASHRYRQRLAQHGIVPSMSRKGCCYDNAAMESFFHTLKVESVRGRVPDQGPGSSRHLRVHRGLLQPTPTALRHRLPQPRAIRAAGRPGCLHHQSV
jgi:transposase InsO family protein